MLTLKKKITSLIIFPMSFAGVKLRLAVSAAFAHAGGGPRFCHCDQKEEHKSVKPQDLKKNVLNVTIWLTDEQLLHDAKYLEFNFFWPKLALN